MKQSAVVRPTSRGDTLSWAKVGGSAAFGENGDVAPSCPTRALETQRPSWGVEKKQRARPESSQRRREEVWKKAQVLERARATSLLLLLVSLRLSHGGAFAEPVETILPLTGFSFSFSFLHSLHQLFESCASPSATLPSKLASTCAAFDLQGPPLTIPFIRSATTWRSASTSSSRRWRSLASFSACPLARPRCRPTTDWSTFSTLES